MAPSNNRNPNNNQPPPFNSQPPPNNDQPPPTGSQNPTIDINFPNHPLYLHPNDHPRLILISKNSWKRSMMIALDAKNKLKIVTGALNEPISALWSELHEHYAQLDGHRIYQLVNDMIALKQQNCSIEVYCHKLKGLWDEHDALEAPYLCNCVCNCENGRNNGDREQIKSLQYDQEEKQREGTMPKPLRSTALSASYVPQSNRYNNTNRNTNSQFPNRPQTGRRSTFKAGVYCTNCFKEGNSGDECYKIKDYPVGHPLHGKYKPPVVKNSGVNDNRNSKVNLVSGQDIASSSTQAETNSNDGNDTVFVRIDQL
ncbi:cysteine-rich receptor-like protein kinase 8 [Tanacetum coccineum]